MNAFCRAVIAASVIASLSGCGLTEVSRENELYQAQLRREDAGKYAKCKLEGEKLGTDARAVRVADCFSLVHTPAPVRIGDSVTPYPRLTALDHVDRFALMAMFSKMVYHRFKEVRERNHPSTCTNNIDKHPLTTMYKVQTENNDPNTQLGERKGYWKVWDDGASGCSALGGMYFETYVFYPACVECKDRKFTEAAIVFRGTENYESQRQRDWTDNFAAAFGHDSDQDKNARDQLDGLTAKLKALGAPGVHIVAAGHSLGGGLAQTAAYYSPDVQEAYAFNTSPVTGWTAIHAGARLHPRQIQNDPTIFRVSQRGEALFYLRRVTTAVDMDRFGRSDFVFDFHNVAPPLVESDAGLREKVSRAVADHDIGLLACQMAARVALRHEGDSEAAFHYTGAMAKHALLRRDASPDWPAGLESMCTPAAMDIIAHNFCPTGGALADVCEQAALRVTGQIK